MYIFELAFDNIPAKKKSEPSIDFISLLRFVIEVDQKIDI